MAIAIPSRKPAKQKETHVIRGEINKPYEPIAVDTEYTPHQALLTYVEGATWQVVYYRHLKTADEQSDAFNINRPGPYQQYVKIENFELKVSDPLSDSYDEQRSLNTVTGSATLMPGLIPDHGDHFIADIGDGRSGFFHVTEIQKKSILKDSTYEIVYELLDYVTPQLLEKLNSSVVKTEYYEKVYSDYGANPRLNEEQYGVFNKIKLWNERIARHYFHSFFNNEHNTFIIPLNGQVVYDPFIVEFITKIWSTDNIPELQYLRVYNRDTSYNRFIQTIWDALIECDPYVLATAKKLFGAIPRRLFQQGNPGLVSINYSQLQCIYHPIVVKDKHGSVVEVPSVGNLTLSESYSDYATKRNFTLSISRLPGLGFKEEEISKVTPDAKKYSTFNTYVLSPAFYSNDKANMSKVERITWDVLERKPVDAKELVTILDDVINWGDVEQFYYIPLLVALSRSALGDLSR